MINVSDYPSIAAAIGFFEEFSSIPHGSGNTRAIADYLVAFAKKRGLEYYRDDSDNVIIRKPATRGYESRPAIILQGHLDMVAEKKPSADIDMTKEGLTLYRDGDFLRARDTTLGGDDGVALAYALAILDSDTVEHPSLEAVFTSDEEIGLLGAVALDPSEIHGRLLINIDSDVEGVLTVGCAGGMRSDISLPVVYGDTVGDCYEITLSGFKGGHSGVEIDKGRVNALKALADLISRLGKVRIADIYGGNADNAIPRDAVCVLSGEDIEKRAEDAFRIIKDGIAIIEPDADISVRKINKSVSALTEESSAALISLLCELPSGIIAMCREPEGLVETSLNLGILRLGDTGADISFSVRSAKGGEKRALGDRIKAIAKKYGADYSERGEYPAWEYREDSHLRDVMVKTYMDMYRKPCEVVIIHAGLECGIFQGKIPELDCVSIGPDNFDIHTTEERLSLSSFERVWNYILQVMKNI